MNTLNKRTIIIAVITIIVMTAAVFGVSYALTFKTVVITVVQPNITADIYKSVFQAEEGSKNNDVKIASINGSQTLSLQAGSYYVSPTSKNTDTSPIAFTVDKTNTAVTVDPGYSTSYLASTLATELPTLQSLLMTKYPQLANFTLNSGKLYGKDDWYATTMVEKAQPGNNGDVYRTVLHKVGGKWIVVATPKLIQTSFDNPSVPENILVELNKETGYNV